MNASHDTIIRTHIEILPAVPQDAIPPVPACDPPCRLPEAQEPRQFAIRQPAFAQKSIASQAIGKHCLIRTFSAGVFAGILAEIQGKEGKVIEARRLWFWSGAASLSQLALDGPKNKLECKFPAALPEVFLTEIIEIIPTTTTARERIEEVPIWEK